MSWNDKGCTDCRTTRPRWHGGRHKCINIGDRVYVGPHAGSLICTEEELSSLAVPITGVVA